MGLGKSRARYMMRPLQLRGDPGVEGGAEELDIVSFSQSEGI